MNVIFWLLAVAVIVFGIMSIIMKEYEKPKVSLALFLSYILCSAVCWCMYVKREDFYGFKTISMLLIICMMITLLSIWAGFLITEHAAKSKTFVVMVTMVIFIIGCAVPNITFSARVKDINPLLLSDKSKYLLKDAGSFDEVRFKIKGATVNVKVIIYDTECCEAPISDVEFHPVSNSYIISYKGILYRTNSRDFYEALGKKDSKLPYTLNIEYSTEEKYYKKNNKINCIGYNHYIYTDCSLNTYME